MKLCQWTVPQDVEDAFGHQIIVFIARQISKKLLTEDEYKTVHLQLLKLPIKQGKLNVVIVLKDVLNV